ncbi:MAG TPA: response regulator [Trichocoleus sp.]
MTVPEMGNAQRARILIVEDHESNRELMKEYLETYGGWQVSAIALGAEFIPAIQSFQPHLVLLDLKLPDMDGYSLLQQLQQDWATIPVFVVSAFAFQADQERAIKLGARRYFVKPTSLSRLHQAIREELQLLEPFSGEINGS